MGLLGSGSDVSCLLHCLMLNLKINGAYIIFYLTYYNEAMNKVQHEVALLFFMEHLTDFTSA